MKNTIPDLKLLNLFPVLPDLAPTNNTPPIAPERTSAAAHNHLREYRSQLSLAPTNTARPHQAYKLHPHSSPDFKGKRPINHNHHPLRHFAIQNLYANTQQSSTILNLYATTQQSSVASSSTSTNVDARAMRSSADQLDGRFLQQQFSDKQIDEPGNQMVQIRAYANGMQLTKGESKPCFQPPPAQVMPLDRRDANRLRPVFQKMLTNSDVSDQQSRLLMKRDTHGCLGEHNIPVKNIRPNVDVMMWDEDEEGRRMWRFIYAVWPSNDSYVLKGGWSTYVEYKALQVGDTITISVDINGDHWIRCSRTSTHNNHL